MFRPLSRPQWVTIALLLAAAGLLPLAISDAYVLHVLILSMIFAIFTSAWNLVAGFAGLKTFGHHAFFGIGAYVSALLGIKAGLSPWLTIWLAAAAAGLAGLAIGLPVLRIRSMPHVAIVTLGFAEIIRIVVANLPSITRGELGLWGIPSVTPFSLPGIGEVSFTPVDKVPFYYLVLALLVLTTLVVSALMRSRLGLSLIAMRDAEDAAESLGVNLTRAKLTVFGLSAVMVGLSGAAYAHYIQILTPSAVLGADLMILVIAMGLVGGLGTLSGPIVGSVLLTVLVELLRDVGNYRLLVYGLLIIAITMFMPRGIAALRPARLRARVLPPG